MRILRPFPQEREPFLTGAQVNRLSEIWVIIGEVALATVVIPAVIGVDKINWLMLISGLVASIASWTISLLLARRLKL